MGHCVEISEVRRKSEKRMKLELMTTLYYRDVLTEAKRQKIFSELELENK